MCAPVIGTILILLSPTGSSLALRLPVPSLTASDSLQPSTFSPSQSPHPMPLSPC